MQDSLRFRSFHNHHQLKRHQLHSRPFLVPLTTRSTDKATCLSTTEEPNSTTSGCRHVNVTRRGSNKYCSMKTCKDCGLQLERKKNDLDTTIPLEPSAQGRCLHQDLSWQGTSGFAWTLNCKACSLVGREKRARSSPIPTKSATSMAASSSGSPAAGTGRTNVNDEDFVTSVEEWKPHISN